MGLFLAAFPFFERLQAGTSHGTDFFDIGFMLSLCPGRRFIDEKKLPLFEALPPFFCSVAVVV